MSDGMGCTCAASCKGDCACDVDWTPQEVYDLRAKIKALEEECLEQARLNGMGSEREALLLGKVSALSSTLAVMRNALWSTHNYLIQGVDHDEYKSGCWCLDENGFSKGSCVYCLASSALATPAVEP